MNALLRRSIAPCLACALVASPSAADESHPLPPRDARWSIATGAVVDTASLARPTEGVALGLDFRRGGLGVRVLASGLVPRDSYGLVDLIATAGVLLPIGERLDVSVCMGAGAGMFYGVGEAHVALRPEGLVTPRIDIGLVPRSLVLSLEPGALFDPSRTSLPDGHRAPVASFRGTASIVARVW